MPSRMNSGAASGQKYGTQKNVRNRRVRKTSSELETDEKTQNKIIFNCFIFLKENH